MLKRNGYLSLRDPSMPLDVRCYAMEVRNPAIEPLSQ